MNNDQLGASAFADPSVQAHLDGDDNENASFLSTPEPTSDAALFGSMDTGGIPQVSYKSTTRSPSAAAGASPPTPSSADGLSAGQSRTAWLCGFLSIDFYRPYFNVNTADVQERLLRACKPWKNDFFEVMGDRPDLYGPLWICTTLVFVVGASSSFSRWFSDDRSVGADLMADAAWVVYGFGLAMPIIAWAVLKYSGISGLSLPNLICLYGYSLVAFIPASLICAVPSAALQWLTLFCAFAYSAAFLLRNLWSELSGHVLPQLATESGSPAGRKRAVVMLTGIIGLHFAFALVMKIVFFSAVGVAATAVASTAAPTAVGTTAAAAATSAPKVTPTPAAAKTHGPK
jgi:hypothetical protein